MRDVELLVFDGYDELAGRVLPGADDGMPRAKAVVHQAVDPEGAAAILVESATEPLGAPAGVKRISARIDPATNRVLTRRTLLEKLLYRIEKSETVETLAQAIRPLRTGLAPAIERDGHVIAFCPDGGSFSRLVRDCLALGCDRIRWTAVGGRGEGRVAARIDQPPYYLLDRWTRHDSDAAPIYVPAAPRFYVRWGWRHPLAGRTAIGENEVVLADGDGSLERIPGEEWRDLYDAVQIAVDGLDAVRWGAAEPAPRFTVKLSLVALDRPVEPELWLLSAEELPAVERLLGLMPESDLKHLAIAFFAEAPGAPRAALREVITGRGRAWVNFARRGFKALPGLSNLFLPVDKALDPQVRRDRVADAFGLKSGEFQVVEAAAGGALRSLKIPEGAFKPLSSYVDYIASASSQRLEALIAASVFDPGALIGLAEAAPDPARVREVPVLKVEAAADGGTAQTESQIRPDGEEPSVVAHVPEPAQPTRSLEQEIESRVALDPPGGAADWTALGNARMAKGDKAGAVECWENARWLDPRLDADLRGKCIAALEAELKLDQIPAAERPEAARRLPAEGDVALLRLLALYLEEGRLPAEPGLGPHLKALYEQARLAAGTERLRKKTRWLCWRPILRLSGDEIEAERQREQILGDLNQSGLAPIDRSDFVRVRLAEQALGAGSESELRRTMDALGRRLSRIEEPRPRLTGISLLARRWAELDDVSQARGLANQAIAGVSSDLATLTSAAARILGNAAAALLKVRDPGAEAPFMRAVEAARRLTNNDDRGRTLSSMLEALASVGESALTGPLSERALAIVEAEGDPRRAALLLARCAPALKKLEASGKARALALSLSRDPQVQRDAHYLAGAVSALATLCREVPLSPANLRPVLDGVRRHLRDLEDVNARLVEGAVALGGEEFAREICDQMRAMPAGELHYWQLASWAFAIQGLAAARVADEGLSDLERALRLAWELPIDDERRRAVRLLTSSISAFGRVGAGLVLIQQVVKRVEPRSVGPYAKSEILTACVDAVSRLGQRQGALEVMARVIELVETTAREAPGDVTFLFDVLGLCVDHAVTLGAPGESAAVIRRVESMVEEWMNESSARFWTPFYRYRALAKCGRGLARLGQEDAGLAILRRILEATHATSGLDRIDLLREIVQSLSEVGGDRRLVLVDRILDTLLAEKSAAIGEAGGEVLSLVLDEVVSPASRVRAEYARFLGAEERAIRERVANERIQPT